MGRGHRSAQYWEQLDRAKKLGFSLKVLKRAQVLVIPPNKLLPAYTSHQGEAAIHPLRRYIDRTAAAMGLVES